MKNLLMFTIIIFIAISCKTTQNKQTVNLSKYPTDLQKVFAKHGGLDTWEQHYALTYQIVKEEGNETHYINLKDRRDRIDAPSFQMGNDGSGIWLKEKGKKYEGNAVFYHNLMFYFYAMPFVLADDGIIYSKADSITFEGQTYPGIKISYGTGIGTSPEDEYFIYYDAKTFEMAWLGYTVTYYSKEKSSNVKWIRYHDWANINGLLLPNSITWYKYEDGKLTEPRGSAEFDGIKLLTTAYKDTFFEKPDNANFVE